VTQNQPGREPLSPRLNTGVAHPARIYDSWLGGKDNFQADREAATVVIEHFPDIIKGVKMHRAFLDGRDRGPGP
jgi:hypothetical protein